MKKFLLLFLLALVVVSCDDNKENVVKGRWKATHTQPTGEGGHYEFYVEFSDDNRFSNYSRYIHPNGKTDYNDIAYYLRDVPYTIEEDYLYFQWMFPGSDIRTFRVMYYRDGDHLTLQYMDEPFRQELPSVYKKEK
ncbi:hypothetical protein M2132_000839 [Dysgonomonas sp. PH5-45]|uniref:hypothetical protein n=1 Tax=unclassified Dysgonomonas TaxID=2630389 RepID=UPI0024741646|nr:MULTISPECIES: hypothetical protein [unclassified Dysgonomonas]MDH6354511.1 hypothetical protein [Dysgonomonas sp. PH5-45]MDH6387432.1 hypothetical protein [Dysgonomonas sp. PH5-37]